MDTFTYTTRPEPATVPLPRPRRRPPRRLWGIAVVAATVLGGGLLADGLGVHGAVVLAVFAAAVGAWVLTPVDDTWIALAAVCVLAVTGVVAPADLFATLGADLVWLLIAAFVLAAGLTRSGLVGRFAVALLGRARTVRQLAHLSVVALVVSSLAVPATSGRAALALPVFGALARALGDRPRVVRAMAVLFPTAVLLSAVSTLIGAGANSSKWGDPRAKLLAGDAWTSAKPMVLASLGLPEDPAEHLAERARLLHDSYRAVASQLPQNAAVSFDDDGRLHLKALQAKADPPSLVSLRGIAHRMLPRVDLPEVLLEVFSWTGVDAAFTSITGGDARLSDLHVTIAALLVAEACNIGWRPVVKPGMAALTRDRLAHVNANYLRLDTIRAANAP